MFLVHWRNTTLRIICTYKLIMEQGCILFNQTIQGQQLQPSVLAKRESLQL